MKIVHIVFDIYFPEDENQKVKSSLIRYESGDYEEIDISSIKTKQALGPLQSVILTYVEDFATENNLKLVDASITHNPLSQHYYYTLSD